MALTINTNIASLTAQNNLSKTQNALNTSLERLSTGLRINSAKDDAAGLAISNRFTTQIRGLNQAVRNANDAISLSQTGEGALQESTNLLQRIRELAVQSANETNTDSDRASLQLEVKELIDEFDRIADTTNFNGKKLFDGSFGSATFQVGANAGETLTVGFSELTASTVGGGLKASASATGFTATAANLTANNTLQSGDLVLNGVVIGSSKAGSDSSSSVAGAASAIAKVAAINEKTSETGVVAEVLTTTREGASMTAATGNGQIIINGVTTGDVAVSTDAVASRAAVVNAINAISDRTGVTATDTGENATGVVLRAADGRNITVSLNQDSGAFTAATTGLSNAGQTTTSGFTLRSVDNTTITVEEGTGDLTRAGLVAGDYQAQTAAVASVSTTAALAAGDLKINGVVVGASKATDDTASSTANNASAIAKAAAINRLSDVTGVTAVVNENRVDGSAQTAAALTGVMTINGVTTASISTTANAADSRTAVVTAINAISGRTGVTAIDTGSDTDGVQLVAADGRNVVTSYDGTLTAAATGVAAAGTTHGTFKLESAGQITVAADTGTLANSGLQVGTFGGASSGQFLEDVDISTVDGATKALEAVDNALSQVDTQRAGLGAVQNRFETTISNLQNVAENLTAARSQIQDADFAAETASLSRAQILQQAGLSILAQANQSQQGVLSLLR